MRVQVLLPENLRNWSPGLCALVIWEETTSPLPVGCLTDGLPQLTRKYRVMVSSGYRLILLLFSAGGPALPFSSFRLSVSYQACMETPIPEVHSPGDTCPDIPRPADAERLCEDDVGKTRGLSEFQVLPSTPCHSAAIMTMNRCPTVPEGVEYQIANFATSRRQQLCQIASSATPLSRCDPLL